MLKRRILQKNVEVTLLSNFQRELAIAYEDLNDYSAIPNRPSSFFEYASFFIKKNGDTVQYHLHVGESMWKSLKIIMQLYGQYFVIKKMIIVLLS